MRKNREALCVKREAQNLKMKFGRIHDFATGPAHVPSNLPSYLFASRITHYALRNKSCVPETVYGTMAHRVYL